MEHSPERRRHHGVSAAHGGGASPRWQRSCVLSAAWLALACADGTTAPPARGPANADVAARPTPAGSFGAAAGDAPTSKRKPLDTPIPKQARRLLLSWTPDWAASDARLRAFERTTNGPWTPRGPAWSAVVGRGGLGWGRGLHGDGAPAGRDGPDKREGDGRAPAGAFRLGRAYGAAAPAAPAGLPFALVSAGLRCVDDATSRHYGAILDEAQLKPAQRDYRSAEHLRRKDDLYDWIITVEHNAAPTLPGAGSCIFLHVWAGPESTTSGCTALATDKMLDLVAFSDARTVLVQLPRAELEALTERWGLPQTR